MEGVEFKVRGNRNPGTDPAQTGMRFNSVYWSGLGSKCRPHLYWLAEWSLLGRTGGIPTGISGDAAKERISASGDWGGEGSAQHLCWEPSSSGPGEGGKRENLALARRRSCSALPGVGSPGHAEPSTFLASCSPPSFYPSLRSPGERISGARGTLHFCRSLSSAFFLSFSPVPLVSILAIASWDWVGE